MEAKIDVMMIRMMADDAATKVMIKEIKAFSADWTLTWRLQYILNCFVLLLILEIRRDDDDDDDDPRASLC